MDGVRDDERGGGPGAGCAGGGAGPAGSEAGTGGAARGAGAAGSAGADAAGGAGAAADDASGASGAAGASTAADDTSGASGAAGASTAADAAPGASGAPDASTAAAFALRPPRNRVDPRAVRWWTAQALLNVLPVAGGLAIAAALLDDARPWLFAALAVAIVGGGAYVVVMPRWRYRVHRWETTDEAVYAAAGWAWQEWRVAPLSRVQTVDTVRGPLQQLFGLATVTVTTASAKGEITIDGLDHALAVEVVDRLTATTQAIPGDAT